MDVTFKPEDIVVEEVERTIGCSLDVLLIFTETIESDESIFSQTNTIILNKMLADILYSQLGKILKKSENYKIEIERKEPK